MKEAKDPTVCHCAGITREEIRQAVFMGARREEEVRILTGKMERGRCQERNPQGTCCSEDFQREIEEALKELRALARLLSGFG